MSAPKALRATSLRDSLAKTVRLLTKQGIDVQFRGHQPYVQTKGNKAVKLVLPEINDSAPPELIEALQGFLDHEVGHIFYTPFARGEKFANGSRTRHSLTNIIEDIRLEKLLPRDLPGTKENLEKMYDSVMDTFFGPVALKAKEPGTSKSEAFSCVMVCSLRALAGQKAFQKFMDDNQLWPHFMPLISKMPNISRRLRDLETFDHVERLVEDLLEALKPPPPPPEPEPGEDDDQPEQKPKKGKSDKQDDEDVSIDPDAGGDDKKDDGASDDSQGGEDKDDDADGGGLDQDPDESKDDGKADKESDDGKGHGDGEGEDDGSDEEAGDCSGDDEGDEDGSGDGDEDGDADSESDGGDSDEGDEGDSDTDKGDTDDGSAGDNARQPRSLKDALAALEPTHRRALFLYKRKKQTVAEIAADLEVSEDKTRDMLAQARRQVRDFLNGG